MNDRTALITGGCGPSFRLRLLQKHALATPRRIDDELLTATRKRAGA